MLEIAQDLLAARASGREALSGEGNVLGDAVARRSLPRMRLGEGKGCLSVHEVIVERACASDDGLQLRHGSI